MKSIPRLIAGTAVVLAAVLTTAPVTAGIADFLLNPGHQPVKRAAPALTGSATPPLAPVKTRADVRDEDDQSGDDQSGDEHSGDELTSDQPAAGLVAHTAADAQARVSDLASDLQAGVDAGEFTQADADRVLGDLSGYIKGERTWPERTAV